MSEISESCVHFLRGWRGEVGLLVPSSWMCREWEIVAPEGVRFSRALLGAEPHTPDALKRMADQIEPEAKKLNQGRKCDLICLSCTSGGFIGGAGYEKMIIEKIEKASGSPATTTITCVLELFKDMGIKKIALVGPYPDFTFHEEIKFLKSYGIETLYWKGLGMVEASEFFNFTMDPYGSYNLVKDGAKAAPEAECIFLTCMASPLLGIADILEREIGKPVVSSQSATLYGILKKLGIPDPINGYGEFLKRPRLSK
jgi:maleate isomerase